MPHREPSHPEHLFPRQSGYAPTGQWINQNLYCVQMRLRNKTNRQLLSVLCPERDLPTSWTDHILFPSRAASSPDSMKLSTLASLAFFMSALFSQIYFLLTSCPLSAETEAIAFLSGTYPGPRQHPRTDLPM